MYHTDNTARHCWACDHSRCNANATSGNIKIVVEMTRNCLAVFLAFSLLAQALCLPPGAVYRWRRNPRDNEVESVDEDLTLDNSSETKDNSQTSSADTAGTTTSDDDDDDDFGDDKTTTSNTSSNGGSNIFSLLNLATAILPSLSGNNNVTKNNEMVNKIIEKAIMQYKVRTFQRRYDTKDNDIEIDNVSQRKPPLSERKKNEDTVDILEVSGSSSAEDTAEESFEDLTNSNENSSSKEKPESNESTAGGDSSTNLSNESNDSDYDEPPDGDGEGGGILGLLAGLSGDGESDLGSLLAAVGGIVANLSGDGVDINALIATGLGLFVGLLSDEGTNPGEIIASYLLTSLDTITGGGATNNGAYFGKFLSTLVKGISAADGESSASSEEDGDNKMADLGGFLASLLMGLLGDMSNHSSAPWR